MCGIIGYTGHQQASPILVEALNNLEYRGYDSAGISVFKDNKTHETYRTAGKVETLKSTLNGHLSGNSGIAHTRWATHGDPTIENAHPHSDEVGSLSVVHNGIVENHLELREQLIKKGHKFSSNTDTETIPHLIEDFINEGHSFDQSVIKAASLIHGANSVVVMNNDHPDTIIAFKKGYAGGLIVGIGNKEALIASDLTAITPHCEKVVHLDDSEVAILKPDHVIFKNLENAFINKNINLVSNNPFASAKGKYRHFMLKEIHEQPESIISSLRGRISFQDNSVRLKDLSISDAKIKKIKKIFLTGMGTSMHAAMLGRLWFEKLAGIPAEWDNSSEFRYRDPLISEHTLFISISQSGETADTLAAMQLMTELEIDQITLSNNPNAQSSRLANDTLQIRAGLEIGVAASKTFTCSLVTLYLLAIHIGIIRGHIDEIQVSNLINELAKLPELMGSLLKRKKTYELLAEKYHNHHDFLFLGRGLNFPIALEGALKLKEISYLHAEGYPAGEMKHGPISLVDNQMPIITIIPQDSTYAKMLNNMSEAQARGGEIIAIASESDKSIKNSADHVIKIPDCSELLSPLLTIIPLQLLSYYIAVRRGCDVDQPRNLAKSVTVE